MVKVGGDGAMLMADHTERCFNCGKAAPMFQTTAGHLLCLDCQDKLVQMTVLRDDMLARREAELIGRAEAMVGLSGVLPRPILRRPIIAGANTTYNNIHVERSTVGVINTGEVGRIDSTVSALRGLGEAKLADAIARLSEAILLSKEIASARQNELLEQLGFLAEQATRSKEEQRPSMIRKTLTILKDVATTVSTIASVWEKFGPVLEGLLR